MQQTPFDESDQLRFGKYAKLVFSRFIDDLTSFGWNTLSNIGPALLVIDSGRRLTLSVLTDESIWPHLAYFGMSAVVLLQRAQFLLARDYGNAKTIADKRYTEERQLNQEPALKVDVEGFTLEGIYGAGRDSTGLREVFEVISGFTLTFHIFNARPQPSGVRTIFIEDLPDGLVMTFEDFIFAPKLHRGDSHKLSLKGTLSYQFYEDLDFDLPVTSVSIAIIDAFGRKHKTPYQPPAIAYEAHQQRLVLKATAGPKDPWLSTC